MAKFVSRQHSVNADQFSVRKYSDAKGVVDDAKLRLAGIRRQSVNVNGHTEVKFATDGPDGPVYFGDGDYLVKDGSGSIRPVDEAVFRAQYEVEK